MYLECKNLSFKYPNNNNKVINNLCFSIKEPGFKAIFGPSGIGKTSLAKIIADTSLEFEGKVIKKDINKILYSYNLERLPGWSTTGKHLNKVIKPEKFVLKEKLIKIFELENVLDSKFFELSMGQQNRINLIRYLLQDYDLLILDESLANVDEKLREKIILNIKELFKNKMFLYISHNLYEISKFCSQILVLAKSSSTKKSCIINGQNYMKNYPINKKNLNSTMLEIMNAF